MSLNVWLWLWLEDELREALRQNGKIETKIKKSVAM